MMTLSDADFHRLYTHIQSHYGIDLSQKKQLISSRLTHSLESQGYTSFTQYVDDILRGTDQNMVTFLINKLTTNYTYFMREEAHFQFLMNTALPEFTRTHAKDHVLSIWSAGCSSGEEAYTTTMYLMEYFGAQYSHWDTRILATDISQQVLDTARNPVYQEGSLEQLPKTWKSKYFIKNRDGSYNLSPEVRKNVIFRTFNLMDPIRFRRPFDLIFCRNVMIYFDQPTKDALVRRFHGATVPGGYFFIGHSENLSKENNPYKYITPAIFQKAGPTR